MPMTKDEYLRAKKLEEKLKDEYRTKVVIDRQKRALEGLADDVRRTRGYNNISVYTGNPRSSGTWAFTINVKDYLTFIKSQLDKQDIELGQARKEYDALFVTDLTTEDT